MSFDFEHPAPGRRSILGGFAAATALAALAPGPAWARDLPPQAARQRDRELLKTGWLYTEGEPVGAERPRFDDGGWTGASLPHTWNAADSLDDEPGYRRDVGWYRRTLRMDQRHKGQRLFLYFEGANQVADVYVQGQHVGGHVGGYSAFSVEITDQLARVRPGQEAVIAVRVDNSHNDDIPPYSADFTFYGGIYRNVWLVATDPVHLDVLDHASPGVKIDTPDVSAAAASVRVRGVVVNDRAETTAVTVRSTVVDAEGYEVSGGKTVLQLRPGASKDFRQELKRITAPNLWSPETPYLYTVSTVIEEEPGGGRRPSRDRVDTSLGLRWFSADPDTGFRLNGKSYPLRGTNRHQDIVGQGNALTDEEHVRDLEIIKTMGANVVRLAHYPQAPAILDAADRLGLVIWEETPLVNRITMTEDFTRSSINMVKDMVRQHYNHPSVIMWGYMNEILLRPPEPEPVGYEAAVVELARTLENQVRAEDSTRLTTMAGHQSERYNTSSLAELPMVFAWNLYLGWYGGTIEMLGPWLDEQHKAHPKRLHWVSEFGADSDSRLHSVDPVRMDQSIEYQQLFNEGYVAQLAERPYLAGTTYWSQFDFGSETRTGSIPHVNMKGLMHSNRKPKDVYYLFEATMSAKPVLHIASREWKHRTGAVPDAKKGSGPQPVIQNVTVYSNLIEVELFQNGRSLGAKKPGSACTAKWDVPFIDGGNQLTAHGRGPDGTIHDDDVDVVFTYRPPRLADPSVPFRQLAVSAGSTVQYTDPDGLIWIEDQEHSDGVWGAIGGKAMLISEYWVDGSEEDPLYQTYREGMSDYRFDVPDGRYEVRLRLVEPTTAKKGERVFDVLLGEGTLVGNLDLAAVAGPRTAYDISGHTEAADGNGITVTFNAKSGSAVVSGIAIRRV